MKRFLSALAVLFLCVSSVSSQQTLPANSVVGRLGIGPGPAQSIPFSILTGNLLLAASGDFTCLPSGVCTIGTGAVSNSKLAPMAANSIKANTASTTAAPVDFGVSTGTVLSIFTPISPINAPGIDIAVGSNAAPITTAGPTLRISRTENFSNTLCNSIQGNNECNAALAVYSKTLASSTMQANAIFAGAQSDAATHDVLGLFAIGRVTGTATGIGSGAYLEGRRDTATGSAQGAEIRSTNLTATPGVYNPTGFSTTIGLWITAGDSQPSAVAVSLGSAPQPWTTGYAATTGSVTATTFRDDTNSNVSLQINGTHAGGQIVGTGFSVDSSGNLTANNITTAWAAFTPSPACGTATFTVNSARRKTIGKTTFLAMDLRITAIGTCTSPVTVTLPNTTNSSVGSTGREYQNAGVVVMCGASAAATTISCAKQSNAAFVVNDAFLISMVYENQ